MVHQKRNSLAMKYCRGRWRNSFPGQQCDFDVAPARAQMRNTSEYVEEAPMPRATSSGPLSLRGSHVLMGGGRVRVRGCQSKERFVLSHPLTPTLSQRERRQG